MEEEFEVGFFQGYADLKMRVAIDHPEWDLVAYSGADSDIWEVDSSTVNEEVLANGVTRGASVSTEV